MLGASLRCPGYEKVYRQLAAVLSQQLGAAHPDLAITGHNYNPGGGRVELSQLLGLLKMAVIAMVVLNFNPWSYLGADTAGPTPSLVTWAMENKIYACLMTFFLCNMVETQLISSGAFEVTVNGEKGKCSLRTMQIFPVLYGTKNPLFPIFSLV